MIDGWTRTWEYLKLDGSQRTNWVMQGYISMASENSGGLEPMVRKILCRIFQSGEPSAPPRDYQHSGDVSGQGSENMNIEPEPAPVIPPPVQNEPELAPVIPVAQDEPEPALVPAAQAAPYNEMPSILFEVEVRYHYFWDSDLEDLKSSSPSCISCLTEEDSDSSGGFEWGRAQVIEGDFESEESASGSSVEYDSESEEEGSSSGSEVED